MARNIRRHRRQSVAPTSSAERWFQQLPRLSQSTKPWRRLALIALLTLLAIGGFALVNLSRQNCALAGIAFARDEITPMAFAPNTSVAMFTPRNGEWPSASLKDVKPGGEFIYQHHLYRVSDSGAVEMVPDVDVSKLPDADRAFDKANYRLPEAADVVMVLDKVMKFTHHAVLGSLQPGIRICFQGRAYDLRAGNTAGTMDIADTGIVSARVTKTFQHCGDKAAHTIIDVTIRTADSKQAVLHATPNHPFFVPNRAEYVELGKLMPGTKLQSAVHEESIIVAINTRNCIRDVYNLEVEGPHNYYVGDQKVLVHNKPAIFRSLGETVDLYRAVGIREYESIMKNRAFLPSGNSLEGRQFAYSLEEALAYASFDTSKVAIIKVTIDKSVLEFMDFSRSIDPFIFKNGVTTVQPWQSKIFHDAIRGIEHVL